MGLQPNPVDTTNDLMIQMINVMINGSDAVNIGTLSSPTGSSLITSAAQKWSYVSLFFSTVAAFAVFWCKQLYYSLEVAQGHTLGEYDRKRHHWQLARVRQLRIVLMQCYGILQLSLFSFCTSLVISLATNQTKTIISEIIIVFIFVLYTLAYFMILWDPRKFFRALARFGPSSHLIQEDATINLSAIDWILHTSAKPDVVKAAAAMVPLMQWPVGYDASAMYTRLRNAFTTYRHNRELFVKCGKAMAHLCLQPAKIRANLTLLRQDSETWDAWEARVFSFATHSRLAVPPGRS